MNDCLVLNSWTGVIHDLEDNKDKKNEWFFFIFPVFRKCFDDLLSIFCKLQNTENKI